VSKTSDISRLEFNLEMIEDIEYTIKENASLTQALENRIGKHALLMCLMQIGESLNKIESPALQEQLPIKGAYDVRNFIAHDYQGVDVDLLENILRHLIPELKMTIKTIL
jgi:uncharacterized protein with HEPN domain